MVLLKDYDLPDEYLFQRDSEPGFLIWQPPGIFAILGASSSVADSLNIINMRRENIKIYKRKTGGQSVILTENMVVISVKTLKMMKNTMDYFKLYSSLIISEVYFW